MAIKTQQEILESLVNDHREIQLSRQASIRVLEKMEAAGKGHVVLNKNFDAQTMQMKEITVSSRLKEMRELADMDERKLEALEEIYKEHGGTL